MSWKFCVNNDLKLDQFVDEIKTCFPNNGTKDVWSDRIVFNYDGFSCHVILEKDDEDDSDFNVIQEIYGISYTYVCRIETYSSYSGDYLLDMMNFVGGLLKRIPGDALLMFNGEEPVVYRHNGQICVAPGIWRVEGLGLPYKEQPWDDGFFRS